jgi:hypothetical protein
MAVTPQAPPGGPDAEALFKEARRLRRRRWLTAAGILPAAATAAAGYLVLADNEKPPVPRIKSAAAAQVPRHPIRVGATLTGPGYVAVSRTGEFASVTYYGQIGWAQQFAWSAAR